VTLCEYFAWLEQNVPSGSVTEMSAAEKLESIKRWVVLCNTCSYNDFTMILQYMYILENLEQTTSAFYKKTKQHIYIHFV